MRGASVLANMPSRPTVGIVANNAAATTPVRTPPLVGHSARAKPIMAKAVSGYSSITTSFTPSTPLPNSWVLNQIRPAIIGGLE